MYEAVRYRQLSLNFFIIAVEEVCKIDREFGSMHARE